MRSHADDLRAEGAPDELADHASHDYREAALDPPVRALCDFAVLLTHASPTVEQRHVDELRSHAWSDEAISDAIQVVAYFNYINRVADGVGIEDEPEWSRAESASAPVTRPRRARPAAADG